MARLMSESSAGHPDCSAASSTASTSNAASSSSPRTSRKPNMATEENNNTSPKRINLQRTPSAKLRGKTVSPPRKPSFKLREIRPGGPKPGYRATKVTVPSNSVALLASRFNAVVVHNDAEGRKLLKRLNSQKQILHTRVSTSTIEGCVKAKIKKFESGDVEAQVGKSDASQQNRSHHLPNGVEKSSKENEKSVHQNDAKHQNSSQHQNNGHQNSVTHQNSASPIGNHHQQPERPKFVIVRKNSSISKFSRKLSQKGIANSMQTSPHLSSIESKDVLQKSGSSVNSTSSSLVKTVRKFPIPPKLTPKPSINQRTIFLKPVLSRCPQSARLKDNIEHSDGGRLSRTVKDATSKAVSKDDESSKMVVRKISSDSVFCSDDETSKSSEGVPKTVKKIWRRYQVTNTRSISSIARDFISSDSSIDGSVVQTLKYVGDGSSSEKNGRQKPDVVKKQVEKCEGCITGGKTELDKKSHSKSCMVQRRIHRGNDDSKVKKEVFRKYLVKSEHIAAVQNELMATNKQTDVKEMKHNEGAGKGHKRYGTIIVNDANVLKSLVNEEDSFVVNKGNINSKSMKPVLKHEVNEDNLEVDKENLHLKITKNSLNKVEVNLIVDKENISSTGANQSSSAKNVEELSDKNSVSTKTQVVKPKLQPKPSKLPESKRKEQVVSKVITSPARSKPITTFGLSVAKDQTILESALNGTLSKEKKNDVNGEFVKDNVVRTVAKNSAGQKDFVKPNRSFLWNTLKDKDSSQNSVVPKEEKNRESSQDPVVPKNEVIHVAAEPNRNKDPKLLETKPKPKDVLDANARNTLESKVKNTSFLFRKSIKSLPADDNLDEPIYMNGQVALSTSDIGSRLKASEIGSNFSSMINFDSGLGRRKTEGTDVGCDFSATKNCLEVGKSKDLPQSQEGAQAIDGNGRQCDGNQCATENGHNEGRRYNKFGNVEDSCEVYEEFGNSDSEGTIYEDVDATGSPDQAQGFKYMNVYITEARNTNIIQVETVNQVLIVSQQATGYEEIKKIEGNDDCGRPKSSNAHFGSDFARNVDPKKGSPQGSGDYSGSKSSYAYIDLNPDVDPKKGSPQGSGDYSGSKSSYAYIDPSSADVVAKKVTDDTYASISGEDFNENIYDDIIHLKPKVQTEVDSCHYECIYQSELAGSSQSDSSCDQSNSLYGVVPGRQLSQSSLGVYQLNEPRANTSETSDDWVDLDTSGGDVEIYLYEKRNKPKVKSSSVSWSQKVRRQWSAKQAGNSSLDGSSDYETASHQYEAVQGRPCTTSTNSLSSPVRRLPEFAFDSDSSFEDDDDDEGVAVSPGQRGSALPQAPEDPRRGVAQNEGIYGFMKQASKRMRKHWSLGKSLRRIRKMSSGTMLGGGVEEQQQQASSVTNGSNTSLNRRRWSSFKSKFKPQLSSSGSVFYLDKDQTETPDCIPNVYSDKPSPTTTPPSVTMATGRLTTTDPRRYSIASSSIRPTSPPPPPPPPSSLHRQSLCEEVIAKRGGLRSVGGVRGRGEKDGGGGGVGIEKSPGECGNGSWLSENDDNNSSWDRRMSGMDMMSDRSSSHGSDLHLRFADEPLYQFYNETVTKEELNKCYSTNDSNRGSVADFDSDGYEEIGSDRLISRPSAMDLITPKQGHHRTLWCEIPEVVQSEILKTLSKDERRLQEAKFEVMTSEASYFKSLTVLEKHFANSAAFNDETVLPAEDRKSLFGHLAAVRRCSEKLLAALDRCWQESVMLAYLSEVVSQHARRHFHVYVTYCTNQIDLNSTLRRLKDTNKRFEEELTRLEADPLCESLSLHSFLMLPMQRVTRMPLLVDAILTKLDTDHAEYQSSKAALRTLNEFVQKCNEATRQQERVIEMVKLSRQLEFSQDVRTLPIVSQSRWLVRSGQVVQLNSETVTQKQTFGRKLTRQGMKVTLFLFNDVMLVTKKKGEESFIVLDHCLRNLIQMTAEDDVGNALKYLIKVAMLKNHEGKLVEMLVSCDSETSQQRWLQAMAPPQASEPGESIYESWDCPQVIAIHVYRASQPDELSIQRGDVINVLRKMADGWYYGERTRDGEKGWFPGNHAQEIISQHIRARNLQQRYRLLMMSGSILESQKVNTNNKKPK